MTILFMHTADGGFLAGDTATGLTSYAYPTSTYAKKAKRNPAKVAAEMLATESAAVRRAMPCIAEQDAKRLQDLEEHAAKERISSAAPRMLATLERIAAADPRHSDFAALAIAAARDTVATVRGEGFNLAG